MFILYQAYFSRKSVKDMKNNKNKNKTIKIDKALMLRISGLIFYDNKSKDKFRIYFQ